MIAIQRILIKLIATNPELRGCVSVKRITELVNEQSEIEITPRSVAYWLSKEGFKCSTYRPNNLAHYDLEIEPIMKLRIKAKQFGLLGVDVDGQTGNPETD